jgi:nitroreductase
MLDQIELPDEVIEELASAARLAPSCFNNQPWRYVFVRDKTMLEKMFGALSEGNAWAKKASCIIAVFGKKENDCVIKDREYYLFDIGMATAFMILRATELGLVAHPIAGFSPQAAKEILGIPGDVMLITLLIVGKKADAEQTGFTEKQIETERQRPERRPLSRIYSIDKYDEALEM